MSTQSQAAAAKAAIHDAEKNGTPLGTACRKAVDKAKNTTAYKKAMAKKKAEREAKMSPSANIKKLLKHTRAHYDFLSHVDGDFWVAVEEEEPGIVALAAEALEQLAAMLRE